MKEYSLKFTQLSKHAPSMVTDSRSKMNKFFMGISKLMVNKCMSSMLICSIYMFPIIVHAKKIEEQKLKQV